jgi:cytochrome P450
MNRAPRALPVVGHALSFLRDKPAFLRAVQQQYGDCVPLDIGGPTWLLNDPADVKHVLVNAAGNYEKTPKLTSARGRELSGRGLHTSTGLEHVYLRRMVQPLFHKRVVEGHAGLVRDVVDAQLATWTTDATVDVLAGCFHVAQQVMLRALFGAPFRDPDDAFAEAVTARRAYIEHFFTSNLPRPEYWPLPVVRRYRAAQRTLHAVIDREVSHRRQAGASGDDWLSMLVSSTDREGQPLTDAQLYDEAITLTATGYETVAAALAWTLHLLSVHGDVQAQLREECAARDALDPVWSDQSLMTRVLNESMRLYPPTWLYVRVAIADDALPTGARIRAGDKIYLSPFTMHRHPAWYASPTTFNPDHFAAAAVRDRPRFAFYPFGGGARQCIGEPFARLELAIILSALLRRFHVAAVRTDAPRWRPSIVLEPRGGLPLRLTAATAPR